MQIEHVMSREVYRCQRRDSAERAAQLMWDHDVGALPVLEGDRLVGMVTDRDLLMAAYTQGRRLAEVVVESAMARHVHCCRPDEQIGVVEGLMIAFRVRRLPVVGEGGHLVGVVSLDDIARASRRERMPPDFDRHLVEALASIAERRGASP